MVGKNRNRNWGKVGSSVLLILGVLLLLAPFWVLLGQLPKVWQSEGMPWAVLWSYSWNSLELLLGVGFGALLLGVPTAYLVASYRFPGRRFFEWALILPLAMPSYIVAFTYSGIFDFTGPVQRFTRHVLGWSSDALVPFNIRSMGGAIFILAMVLYPYVYVVARTAFRQQSQSLLEASRLMGEGALRRFWFLRLPLARPAIVGGLALVLMEVLNDYGAVKYYGVPTFTLGIFRAWFSMNDRPLAIAFALLLLLIIGGLLALERWQRGRQRYQLSTKHKPLRREQLGGRKALLAVLLCALPLLGGFVLPALQLSYWAMGHLEVFQETEFWTTLWGSLRLALSAALLTTLAAFGLATAQQGRGAKWRGRLARLGALGYAVPGAVIAMGVLIAAFWVDKNYFGELVLLGTGAALLYALLVRFLAVSYNSIEAGWARLPESLAEASRSLGQSRWRTLWYIQLPLLRSSILAGLLLVWVDVLKELPLTLILRPFNFDTLATKTFELADDEQLAQSAIYALVVVAIGLLPVLGINRLLRK